MSNLNRENIKPIHDKILVHNIEQGDKVVGGIIVLDDNGKERGIRERWAQVFMVGSDIDFINEGEWVLIEHGRWSRGIDLKNEKGEIYTTIRQIDPACLLMASSERPDHLSKYDDAKCLQRQVDCELDTFAGDTVDVAFQHILNENADRIKARGGL